MSLSSITSEQLSLVAMPRDVFHRNKDRRQILLWLFCVDL